MSNWVTVSSLDAVNGFRVFFGMMMIEWYEMVHLEDEDGPFEMQYNGIRNRNDIEDNGFIHRWNPTYKREETKEQRLHRLMEPCDWELMKETEYEKRCREEFMTEKIILHMNILKAFTRTGF